MTSDMDPTTGFALAGVFGSLFVITCFISAIKAVRDRKRIKARIAEREKQKTEQGTRNGQTKASIEENTSSSITIDYKDDKTKQTINGKITSDACLPLSVSRLETPVQYSYINGVDNLTYAHSQTDIKSVKHEQTSQPKSKQTTADLFPPQPHMTSKRTRSHDPMEGPERNNLHHLSHECLAVQKLLRRHSYEMAICEHSWLPMMDAPSFASSESIANTYNYGCGPSVKLSTVGFENKAFDREDYKKT